MKQKICFEHDLAERDCREFILQTPGAQDVEAFLVCFKGNYFAYRNQCPHTGANLNWQPEQFFNYEGDLLQCSLHGALFNPDDGKCIRGPCLGQGLAVLQVEVEDNVIFVSF